MVPYQSKEGAQHDFDCQIGGEYRLLVAPAYAQKIEKMASLNSYLHQFHDQRGSRRVLYPKGLRERRLQNFGLKLVCAFLPLLAVSDVSFFCAGPDRSQ